MYSLTSSQERAGTSGVRLTSFDRWYANLLPAFVKKVLPPWTISAGLVTLMAFYTDDRFLTTAIALFWSSISFALLFAKLRLGQHRWLIPAYHVALSILIASPVMAQSAAGSACSTTGLFSGVTNFVNTLFASITFGGIGGGTLSNLICQAVGFLTIALLLGFLGVLGYTAFQIGYQRQPLSTVLDPLMGFLIFAGGATVVIGVMIGSTTTP